MMLKGLFKLSWIETKIFLREPMGVVGTLVHARRSSSSIMARVPSRRPTARRGARTSGIQRDDPRFAADRARRGAVADRDHGDLPRRRNPQAAPRHAALAGDDPLGARAGEARLTLVELSAARARGPSRDAGRDAARTWSVSPPPSCSAPSASSPGLPRGEPGADRTFRPAARRGGVLPDARAVRTCSSPSSACRSALRVVADMLPTTHAVTLMRGTFDGTAWSAQWGSVLALLAIFTVCLRWRRGGFGGNERPLPVASSEYLVARLAC